MDSMDLETMTDMALNKIADLARQAADLQRDKRALEHICDRKDREISDLKTDVGALREELRHLKALLSVERQQ